MRVSLLVISLTLVAGCNGTGGGGSPDPPSTTPPEPVAPFDPSTAATVTGTVRFQGQGPGERPVARNADPYCARQDVTQTGPPFLVLGDDGETLGNVFVHVKDGLLGRSFPVPDEPVILDQKGCVYFPRVFGVQAGQPLLIRNSDATLHNVHALPMDNREFNISQPVQGAENRVSFDQPEVMVPIKCDVHGWMRSFAGVVDHPHYDVTPPAGTFALQGLPPGDYVVEAWHERLGAQEARVSLGPSEASQLDFTFRRD